MGHSVDSAVPTMSALLQGELAHRLGTRGHRGALPRLAAVIDDVLPSSWLERHVSRAVPLVHRDSHRSGTVGLLPTAPNSAERTEN